jgi:hypothetical protein
MRFARDTEKGHPLARAAHRTAEARFGARETPAPRQDQGLRIELHSHGEQRANMSAALKANAWQRGWATRSGMCEVGEPGGRPK